MIEDNLHYFCAKIQHLDCPHSKFLCLHKLIACGGMVASRLYEKTPASMRIEAGVQKRVWID